MYFSEGCEGRRYLLNVVQDSCSFWTLLALACHSETSSWASISTIICSLVHAGIRHVLPLLLLAKLSQQSLASKLMFFLEMTAKALPQFLLDDEKKRSENNYKNDWHAPKTQLHEHLYHCNQGKETSLSQLVSRDHITPLSQTPNRLRNTTSTVQSTTTQ